MHKIKLGLVALMTGLFLGQPLLVQAGCGCSKPPPELAEVRPNVTYAGTDVTLFHTALQSGASYDVTFTSGITGESAMVKGAKAVTQRDFADSQDKPQLVVSLPEMPLGPTSISLADQTGTLMTLADDAFTVAPDPVVFFSDKGEKQLADYQAAVSRAGVLYISLNITGMQHARIFQTQAFGYPVRFTHDDVVFYNTQGFMMQMLDESMPGLFSLEAIDSAVNGDILQYSRHEFNTYVLQHAENQPHAVDANDPSWHEDGTPHIDHDHLIVAIAGVLDDGTLPQPGATPPFTLSLSTLSFFEQGLFGKTLVDLANSVTIDSYDSSTKKHPERYSPSGSVRSNGSVQVMNSALVDGDVTGAVVAVDKSATVTGVTQQAATPVDTLLVDIPNGLEDLGSLVLQNTHDSLTLGPGSYLVSELSLNGGQLIIDNTTGPVTFYVTGPVYVDGNAEVIMTDADPEKFAVYVAYNHPVTLKGQGSFYGVVYAPESLVDINGLGEFSGAFVGDVLSLGGLTQVHYDTALRVKNTTPEDDQGEAEQGDSGSTDGGKDKKKK